MTWEYKVVYAPDSIFSMGVNPRETGKNAEINWNSYVGPHLEAGWRIKELMPIQWNGHTSTWFRGFFLEREAP